MLPLAESLARTILWFRIGGRFFCEKCSNFLSRVLIQSKVVRMRERKAFAVQKKWAQGFTITMVLVSCGT
jgi:hypothetical protein